MLIGIDLGTTALKVAAFDPKTGKMLHGVEKRLPLGLDSDGWREQSPAAVVRALRSAIGQLGKTLGGLKKVTGMALAAQGGSTIIADRETGDAHAPMILWNDARAFSQFQELAASKPARYWRTRTLRDEPGMGLARIAWLREHAPELLDDCNLYVGAGEYVYHHLTGLWRQDACNAMQIGCYDARTQSLSKELAALADISTGFVAPLRQGHEFHPLSSAGAKLFGLPEGIPVAGPYMDHEAGFLAASHVSERPLQCSLGTAWVGNFCLPEGIQGAAPFQFAIPSPKGSEPLIIMPLLTGNVTWDWALSTLVDGNTEEALKKQQVVFKSAVLPP
ncbi:MAG: hypothetical protein L3K26_03415, partial [Candidatus Hydrogenedentes bacterium]|nr:hypothetical protein [Candidatus Hydrogenedentota bacterium]